MTPTRNNRWSYPVTMCLAPRYMNGPIAAPWFFSTNCPSRCDTPCALAVQGDSTARQISIATPVRRLRLLTMKYLYQRCRGTVKIFHCESDPSSLDSPEQE